MRSALAPALSALATSPQAVVLRELLSVLRPELPAAVLAVLQPLAIPQLNLLTPALLPMLPSAMLPVLLSTPTP